ncbi:MAG TPA: ATPase, partial [Thermoplasmataceae archaeon]|nr:ATPase [Thermoplasmataceae archaeon]
ESTIRLAEAAAKARLSPIVTPKDALLAKAVVDFYLKDVSMNNGVVDIDILLTGMSSGQRNEVETVHDIIRDMKRENKRAPTVQSVIETAVSRGISKERVTTIINNMKKNGMIYSPNDRTVDLVSRD